MTFYEFIRGIIVAILTWLGDGVTWIVLQINWQPLTGFAGWVGGIIMSEPSINLLTILSGIITVFLIIFINLIMMMWFELKLFARFYHGRGPTEVGYAGLLQNIAHGIKLFMKELIIPKKVDKWAYLIAPIIYIGTSFAVFVAIPWTEGFYLGRKDLAGGFLIVFAIFSMAPFLIFISGWASNNKFSLIGGIRSATQMISYEIPLLLSVVGVILLAHSLSLTEIVGAQSQTLGILPVWFLLLQPLGALLFFTAAVAELERIPFDLPEAEAELVEGWKTEYGGLRFGLIMFTEWARAFAGCSLFVLLFLGGWQGPLMETSLFGMDLGPIIGLVWFFIKVYIVFGVMVWVRASFPRVRIDQLLRVCWNTLLPLGLINIFLTVMVITLLSGFGVTYAIGFALGSFFLMVLLLFVRPEVEPLPQEDTLTSGGKKERTPALRTLVLKPLWVTMKHLFRRPATLMYPYETLKKPHTTAYYPVTKKIARVYEDGVFGVPDIWRNYRGAIGLDVDACISCGLCGRICPNRCITYVEFPGRDKNKKVPRVDFGVCMFCGLCAEYCPKGCIFLTSEYDLSAFDRNDLIYGPEKLSMFRGLKPETRFPERARELPSWEISKCIGCQLCSRRCPTGAITMIDSAIYIEKYGITWDETKKRPKSLPEFTGDKCVSCGTCAEVCPRRVITMDTPDSKGGIDK